MGKISLRTPVETVVRASANTGVGHLARRSPLGERCQRAQQPLLLAHHSRCPQPPPPPPPPTADEAAGGRPGGTPQGTRTARRARPPSLQGARRDVGRDRRTPGVRKVEPAPGVGRSRRARVRVADARVARDRRSRRNHEVDHRPRRGRRRTRRRRRSRRCPSGIARVSARRARAATRRDAPGLDGRGRVPHRAAAAARAAARAPSADRGSRRRSGDDAGRSVDPVAPGRPRTRLLRRCRRSC